MLDETNAGRKVEQRLSNNNNLCVRLHGSYFVAASLAPLESRLPQRGGGGAKGPLPAFCGIS